MAFEWGGSVIFIIHLDYNELCVGNLSTINNFCSFYIHLFIGPIQFPLNLNDIKITSSNCHQRQLYIFLSNIHSDISTIYIVWDLKSHTTHWYTITHTHTHIYTHSHTKITKFLSKKVYIINKYPPSCLMN